MEAKKTERLTMNVEEAGEALGISRATAYLLTRTGQLPTIRLGERRLVVPKIAIERMLAEAGNKAGQDSELEGRAEWGRMMYQAGKQEGMEEVVKFVTLKRHKPEDYETVRPNNPDFICWISKAEWQAKLKSWNIDWRCRNE